VGIVVLAVRTQRGRHADQHRNAARQRRELVVASIRGSAATARRPRPSDVGAARQQARDLVSVGVDGDIVVARRRDRLAPMAVGVIGLGYVGLSLAVASGDPFLELGSGRRPANVPAWPLGQAD